MQAIPGHRVSRDRPCPGETRWPDRGRLRPLSIAPADLPALGRVARNKSLPWYLVRRAPHRPGQHPRPAQQHRRRPDVRGRGQRLEDPSPLRARRPVQTLGLTDPTQVPQANFSPSSRFRLSGLPASSRSPMECISPTGRVRTWPVKPSSRSSSQRSPRARTGRSSTRSISCCTGPATGEGSGWMSGAKTE
jgi:hypothetical protein